MRSLGVIFLADVVGYSKMMAMMNGDIKSHKNISKRNNCSYLD